MAAFFGDLERFFADLYPYRWPLTIGALIVLAGVVAYSYRKGWHLVVWRHRVAVAIVGTPVLAALIVGGWWLGSPLFTSKTVNEDFPFAFNATVPSDMTRTAVEQTMAGMANINQKINETMPDSLILSKTATTVGDQTPDAPGTQLLAVKVKSGSFRDADNFHKGSGRTVIYRGADGSHLLRLEGLSVTNGPDLHVILTPHESPDSRSDVHVPGYVDLGKLKGNKGNQNYEIPDDVDVAAQGSVVIYCKPFHVVFSVATLQDLS